MRPAEVISIEDYEDLPDDAFRKFVKIEQICRRNMNLMMGEDTSSDYDAFVRLQYVRVILTASGELGITGLNSFAHHMVSDEITWTECNLFQIAVKQVCTRLLLNEPNNSKQSVRMAERTRLCIEQQISILREIIQRDVSPAHKMQSLLKRLDDLALELSHKRSNLGVILALLGPLAACTTICAEGPKAIHNILVCLGIDKMAEEAEIERLGSPPRQPALPSPNPITRPQLTSMQSAIDDDIPF